MTRVPYTVEPDDSVTHAIMLLGERQINQMLMAAEGRLVAVITDRGLRDAWTPAPGWLADVPAGALRLSLVAG